MNVNVTEKIKQTNIQMQAFTDLETGVWSVYFLHAFSVPVQYLERTQEIRPVCRFFNKNTTSY